MSRRLAGRASMREAAGAYCDVWPSLDDPALQLADDTVNYGELLVVGTAIGLLDPAISETARGLSALGLGHANPSDSEVRKAAEAFRRSRRLQSGEDLRSWLATRSLSKEEWEAHLRRRLAARDARLPAGVACETSSVGFHEALAVDLACSGWWKKAADALVRCWAAGRLNPDSVHGSAAESDPPGDQLPSGCSPQQLSAQLAPFGIIDAGWCELCLTRLARRRQALEMVEQRFASADSVALRISDHAVDWIEFSYDSLTFGTAAAAAEALKCAEEDGLAADEIARRSRGDLERVTARRDRLPAGTAALLAGAVFGSAIGPLQTSAGTSVLWLRERRPPSPDDTALCGEAAEELLAEALERVTAGRVHAIGPL